MKRTRSVAFVALAGILLAQLVGIDEASAEISAPAALTDGRDINGEIAGASDRLLDVAVTNTDYSVAERRYSDLLAALGRSNRNIEVGLAKINLIGVKITATEGHLARSLAHEEKLAQRAETLEKYLDVVVTERYVSNGIDLDSLDPTETADSRLDRSHERTIGEEATKATGQSLANVTATARRAADETAFLFASLRDSEDELTRTEESIERSRQDATAFAAKVPVLEEALRQARALATVDGTDMTLVALDAYVRAADSLGASQPSCGIEWWALAGIGRSESRHGQHSGTVPAIDGDVSIPIRGVALDGTGNTAAIGDTDGGAIDGDATTDRAVGPMQFIPSTWVRYASDMNGDDIYDPHNIYDAALAAAVYLCRYGPGLGTDEGLRRAFFGYNRSDAYVELVLSRARGYQAALDLTYA